MKKNKLLKTVAKHTAGLRNALRVSRTELHKGRPVKKLIKRLSCRTGKNHSGRRVSLRNNGVKRFYRIIDFKRNDFEQHYKVIRKEYDPNRTTFIILVENIQTKEKKYFLCPREIKIGDILKNTEKPIMFSYGDRSYIKNFDTGNYVYNLELTKGRGGKLARSAGNFVIVMKKTPKYVEIQMPSKKRRLIPNDCLASYGSLSNSLHILERYGKASYYRYKGWKPRVSGITKNACDHPLGGHGSTLGRPAVSKTGLLSVGGKTRKKHKYSNKFILFKKKKVKKNYKLNNNKKNK